MYNFELGPLSEQNPLLQMQSRSWRNVQNRMNDTLSSSRNYFSCLLHVSSSLVGVQWPSVQMFPILNLSWMNPESIFFPSAQRRSRLLGHRGRRRDRPLQRPVVRERRGTPVRLVEVDVKRPCPVGEDSLLRDEAVVAAPPPPLMRDVHGAFIRAVWLVVVVRDRVVLRLPGEGRETVDI